MAPGLERRPLGWSLGKQLGVALAVGAFFVALVAGWLGADRDARHRQADVAQGELALAITLAERGAPLLERGDMMRLSVLAALVRDQVGGRALLLDRSGRVVIDTALALGEQQLNLVARSGPFQRPCPRGEGVSFRESIAPVRFGGEVVGEVRLQCEPRPVAAGFDFGWFAIVFLCSLSLVAAGTLLGHQAQARGALAAPAVGADLQQVGDVLQELDRGTQAGLQLVGDGYVAMALQLVDGLERRRLVPPGHGERTAALAARLASRLKLSATERRELETACRLVDLGKAWVRPSILQKQGPLTDVEARSLQHHPVRAAEQLDRVPALRGIARIVRHQQERHDGGGSPDGLRGSRIPVGARILSIAAAFDLLTNCAGDSELDWQRALQQIDRARGDVFDPDLVKLFAEEIQKAPPQACADRDVMIVPNGVMPWREAPRDDDDGDDGDDVTVADLEVVADDAVREEGA